MISHTDPHAIYGVAGILSIVLFGRIAEHRIDQWRKQVGYAPLPSTNRAGNAVYKRRLWQDMPADVRRQVQILRGVGLTLAAAGIFFAER
jgi:hypothetical protein